MFKKLFLVALLMLAITGCSKSPVGVWEVKKIVDNEGNIYSTYAEYVDYYGDYFLVIDKNDVAYFVTTERNEIDYVIESEWSLNKKGDRIHFFGGEVKGSYNGKKIVLHGDFENITFERSKRKFDMNELAYW